MNHQLFAKYDFQPLNDRTNGSSGRNADTKVVRTTAAKPFAEAISKTIEDITYRFDIGSASQTVVLGNANALLMSRLLDLIVKQGLISEDQCESEMARLYGRIGVL